MQNFRDGMIGVLAVLASILVLTFMLNPEHIGKTLRQIDDARFFELDQDNGPILD